MKESLKNLAKDLMKATALAGLAIIACALLFLSIDTPKAKAQLQPPTTSTVLVIAAVTSNTPVGTFTIDTRRQQNVAVEWAFELGGAGTELMGLRFVPSAQPSAIPTTPTLADGYYMAIAANGATTVRVATNFNTKGYPFLHCYYITNGNASFVLTNRISYWVKANAP